MPAGLPELEILTGSGGVRVSRDDRAEETRLVLTPVRWDEDCALRFDGDRDRAVLAVERHSGRSPRRCEADIDLILAGETAVHIEAIRGLIALEDTATPVAVDLQRGRIELQHPHGPLDLYVAAGSIRGSARGRDVSAYVGVGRIRLEDLSAPLDAEVGLGAVSLTYTAVPSGQVWARTGLGRIAVDFPYGSWLDGRLDPGLGRVDSQIPFSSDAYTQLDASTRVGNIVIGTVLDLPGADLATSVTESEAPAGRERSEP